MCAAHDCWSAPRGMQRSRLRLPQPFTLLGDWLMHSPLHVLLDFLERRPRSSPRAFRFRAKRPRRDRPQMNVNPRKLTPFEFPGPLLSSLWLALKLADPRCCTLQLAFDFVDPRCPLPGRLDP